MPRKTKQLSNVAEIWVPKNTPESELMELTKHYQAQGLVPVVYKSGKSDFIETTCALLRTNCNL